MGDPDWDGVLDAQVGARADDDGASVSGAMHTLYINSDGIVKTVEKISSTQGGLSGALGGGGNFGSSVTFVGDLDGDGCWTPWSGQGMMTTVVQTKALCTGSSCMTSHVRKK